LFAKYIFFDQIMKPNPLLQCLLRHAHRNEILFSHIFFCDVTTVAKLHQSGDEVLVCHSCLAPQALIGPENMVESISEDQKQRNEHIIGKCSNCKV
jgi:hypothetical protein